MTDSDTKPVGRPRSGRWRLGIVAAVLLTMASLFGVVFQAAGFQQYVVLSWLEDLERRCGIHMDMTAYSWNWPIRLTIEDVKIQVEGKPLLQSDRAEISFSPMWRKPFWHATELVLDHPIFYLQKDSRGRWRGVPPVTKIPDAVPRVRSGGSMGDSALTITIRVQSGAIVAEQDGHRVLSAGNVSGQLVVPYDGGVGVGSLLANLQYLRPAAPRALTLRGGNANHPEESAR
ncbi:MAG: hypothetical protein MUC98_17490 [Desulfobacterota bacterium]|nr:hypothetical protein [Thermodesulfobacteriota bacterium]